MRPRTRAQATASAAPITTQLSVLTKGAVGRPWMPSATPTSANPVQASTPMRTMRRVPQEKSTAPEMSKQVKALDMSEG